MVKCTPRVLIYIFLWHRFLNSSTVGDMKLFQPAYMDAFALDPMILYT